jgi:acyl-CoA synthetase (AMP-forming)/AMP-acid ligase II/acyl carrier protein
MPRLDSAAMDCAPAAILTDGATLDALDADKLCAAAQTIPRLAVDRLTNDKYLDPNSLDIDPKSLALLQYTSGSTSEPKGVMVRHESMIANLEAIRQGFGIDWNDDEATDVDTGVFWLPHFHDMGLIGGLLEPLYVGGHTIAMSPRAFLQRPIRWLQYMSDYRAAISGAPNFAYQLCVDRISPEQIDALDLSHWRIAFSGAEPILPRTLRDFSTRFSAVGFSDRAFYPCYGLAEATLLAAGGHGPSQPNVLSVHRESLGQGIADIVNVHTQTPNDGDLKTKSAASQATQQLVCCGFPANETELLIIDPATNNILDEDSVGEIWLRGSSVSSGYWNKPEENESRFGATTSDGRTGFCRTGDLGFLHDRQLFVTGRSKDVVILRGRNHFPQDIEATIDEVIGAQGGKSAAFAVAGPKSESLAVIAEVPRRFDDTNLPELAKQIRRAIIETHEVDPRHVCLVRQATVPLTSSGKVQRNRCRELFDKGDIKFKYRYDRASATDGSPIPLPAIPESATEKDHDFVTAQIEGWMSQWLVARANVPEKEIDLDKPFAEYGLDSMTAVELSGETEDWSGVELTPVVAWNYPTVSKLSDFLATSLLGMEETAADSDDEIDSLLDELAGLSDDEIDHALSDE